MIDGLEESILYLYLKMRLPINDIATTLSYPIAKINKFLKVTGMIDVVKYKKVRPWVYHSIIELYSHNMSTRDIANYVPIGATMIANILRENNILRSTRVKSTITDTEIHDIINQCKQQYPDIIDSIPDTDGWLDQNHPLYNIIYTIEAMEALYGRNWYNRYPPCPTCGKPVKVLPCRDRTGDVHYCDDICYRKWQKVNHALN